MNGEPSLEGSAPVLIGDAPAPATISNEREAASSAVPAESSPAAELSGSPAPSSSSDPDLEVPEPALGGGARSSTGRQAARAAAPVSIRIPRIDAGASIVPVGFNDRGEMAAPDDFQEVAWWQYGASPGEFGRAVLAGHIDSPTGPAVFYDLDELAPGDEIFVVGEAGSPEMRFIVSGAALYRAEDAPLNHIFGSSTKRELILITCGGTFNRSTGEYLYRRVVFAMLATPAVTALPANGSQRFS